MSRDLDPAGLAAARRSAHWHIGDPEWADLILDAYFDPEDANTALDQEQDA